MTTRERVQVAAQAMLEGSPEAHLASHPPETIAEQAVRFGIARATMTKLRHLARHYPERLQQVARGACSLDAAYRGVEPQTRRGPHPEWVALQAFVRIDTDEDRQDFFRTCFHLRRCAPKTLVRLLWETLSPAERQDWLYWCMFPGDPSTTDRRPRNGSAGQADRYACFTTLGLTWPCTEADVKRAYHQQAHEVHPDKGGSAAAFQALQTAYKEAMDVVSRTNGGEARP